MANNERKAVGNYLSVNPCAKTKENELQEKFWLRERKTYISKIKLFEIQPNKIADLKYNK